MIIGVDLFGQPADYEAVIRIASKYELFVIEDAAQSFGGRTPDGPACSFGEIATTSFFPAKPLGCYGDGGALFTDDDEIASLLRSLCVHGQGKNKYENVRVGLNSRLDTIQAAVLLAKLTIFDDELCARSTVAKQYGDALSARFTVPFVESGYSSSWAQYTLQTDRRDEIVETLRSSGIPVAVYYPTCLHEQEAFHKLNDGSSRLPVAEKLAGRVFSIPMHPYLPSDSIGEICEKLNSIR